VIEAEAGKTYEISVWVTGVCWYNDYPEYVDNSRAEQTQLITRIGADPYGGGDPTADSVVWNEPCYYGVDVEAEGAEYNTRWGTDYIYRVNGKWYNETITVTAEADRITVILSGINRIGIVTDNVVPVEEANSYVFFDDVEVTKLSTAVEWTSPTYTTRFNMVSIPILPEDGNLEASAVYNDVIAAGNTLTGALYKYDAGYKIYPTNFTLMEVGRGYWLKLTVAAAETITGNELSEGDISKPLIKGWQMIGHPRVNPVLLSNLNVDSGGTVYTWAQAVANGWIQGTLYTYVSGSGYLSVVVGGARDRLEAGKGYWLKTYVTGLTLIVPPAP